MGKFFSRSNLSKLPGILISFGIPALFVAAGAIAVVMWLQVKPSPSDIVPRVPRLGVKAPAPPPAQPATTTTTTVTATSQVATGQQASTPVSPTPATTTATTASATAVPNLPGSWPRYRGSDFDNISTDTVPLASSWGASGPKRLWGVSLGDGYAAAAIANSRVYVLDYDMTARADKLRCFALANGRELWDTSYPIVIKENHGMSRTIPAVSGNYVLTLDPKCNVMCTDAMTGKVYWKMNLVQKYGTTVPPWYAGQCPLIDENRAILAPGGSKLMIAADLATGKVIWETPNPFGWKMTHSSIIPMTISGQRMYVYCATGGVVGVSPTDGKILWHTDAWRVSTATIPCPIPVKPDRIFLCGGYNSGAMMLRLKAKGGKLTPEVVYRLKPNVFGSDQQTPILYKNYIYGVIPGGKLACLDLNGKQVWTSGSTRRYGLGPYLIAQGMIYALTEKGVLVLVKASPSGYQELASARILNGPEAWGPLALAGGRLIARDLHTMVCVDVEK